MNLFQGNLALFVGVAALLGTVVAFRSARQPQLHEDLRGAMVWLAVFVVLRLSDYGIERVMPVEWHPYFNVCWMIAFAVGVIRTGVAALMWASRHVWGMQTVKIHRDVLDFVLYGLATIPILKTQLKLDVTTLLGTSAVLSLVLGFALQDTLGNLFSGLALQLEQPYKVGDFLQVGDRVGRVVQVAWRSVKLETVRAETVMVPNSVIAKEKVVNFTRGGSPVAVDLLVGASYDASPSTVKAEMLEALREAPLVLDDPPPTCRVHEFGESAVQYLLRFFILDYFTLPSAKDEVLARLWYRFGRASIEFPYPRRVLAHRVEAPLERGPTETLLAQLELFAPFSHAERSAIAAKAKQRRFGVGEAVVVEGRPGDTYYVVVHGTLAVRRGASSREVALLGRGDGFGEMSLLTGEPRAATVVALEECIVLELDREAFGTHFAANPERAQAMAELLAARKVALSETPHQSLDDSDDETRSILTRLKRIFGVKG